MLRYSPELRHAQLAQIEAVAGPAALLRIYGGAVPASTAAAAGATLCEMVLPSDWMAVPGATVVGRVDKLGTWTGTGQAAAGAGTLATYFRIWNAGGSVCHVQGSVTEPNGGGDLHMATRTIVSGVGVEATLFRVTAANA